MISWNLLTLEQRKKKRLSGKPYVIITVTEKINISFHKKSPN